MNEKAKIFIKNTFLCGSVSYIIGSILNYYGINTYLPFNLKGKLVAAIVLVVSIKEIERRGL